MRWSILLLLLLGATGCGPRDVEEKAASGLVTAPDVVGCWRLRWEAEPERQLWLPDTLHLAAELAPCDGCPGGYRSGARAVAHVGYTDPPAPDVDPESGIAAPFPVHHDEWWTMRDDTVEVVLYATLDEFRVRVGADHAVMRGSGVRWTDGGGEPPPTPVEVRRIPCSADASAVAHPRR